jgi:uncharacterized DUF497 family protein
MRQPDPDRAAHDCLGNRRALALLFGWLGQRKPPTTHLQLNTASASQPEFTGWLALVAYEPWMLRQTAISFRARQFQNRRTVRRRLDRMYDCAYNPVIDYEWDPAKARTNLRKHGIDFADVVAIFEDDEALTLEDNDTDEERFVTIGLDALGRIIVVVYAWRKEIIRIISARKATPRERKQYEGEQ